jgi:IMP dehydrogenase
MEDTKGRSVRSAVKQFAGQSGDGLSFPLALTFDDVLLVPQYSNVRPRQVDLTTRLTTEIDLKLPIVSAAMDTVTESAMATQLALRGGLGFIHKNLTPEEQAAEVETVKRFENGFINGPVTLHPDDTITQANEIRQRLGY